MGILDICPEGVFLSAAGLALAAYSLAYLGDLILAAAGFFYFLAGVCIVRVSRLSKKLYYRRVREVGRR